VVSLYKPKNRSIQKKDKKDNKNTNCAAVIKHYHNHHATAFQHQRKKEKGKKTSIRDKISQTEREENMPTERHEHHTQAC